MKTVGELLKKTRIEKNITLEEAERATKIRVKHLDALEKNEYEKLPPMPFIKGFIKNYGQFLGMNQNQLIAVFRREFDEKETSSQINLGEEKRPIKLPIQITPNLTLGIAASALILLFFGYLLREFLSFTGTPLLMVQSPQNNQVLKTKSVQVIGKTDPDAALSINGQKVELNTDGTFSQAVYLAPGLNKITISTTNKIKKTKIIQRTVRLELENR